MLLETLLATNQPPHEISHIFVRNNITFFKIHNESFCCAASHVHHNSSPMFDSIPLKIFARNAHEPEAIANHKEMVEQVNSDLDLWYKHKEQLYATLFPTAVKIFADHGIEKMIEFIDHHFYLEPEHGAKTIMKKLEE